jgi:hypothetical protein
MVLILSCFLKVYPEPGLAMGKSKEEPDFFISAGARFTTSFVRGLY